MQDADRAARDENVFMDKSPRCDGAALLARGDDDMMTLA
jgi:hypothetical protein